MDQNKHINKKQKGELPMVLVIFGLAIYIFVYCVVLLFLGNFSGGTSMNPQIVAAIIGAIVSVVGIIGSLIKGRKDEKYEHEKLNKEHEGLSKEHEGLSKEHAEVKEQINERYSGLSKEHTGLKEQLNERYSGLSKEHEGLKEQLNEKYSVLQRQFVEARGSLRYLRDESIQMKNFQKEVERQGIDVTALKASIDALVEKKGEDILRTKELSLDLAKTKQVLADTERKLRECQQDLSLCQRENKQLKQQIYDLQHPVSWDDMER